MMFALPPRRAVYALAGLAAACAAPALAYDDKSTITSVMELVGVSTDDGVSKIDYSERPKLVLPPRMGDLPPPVERTRAESGSDDFSARRRAAERYARVPGAEPEKKVGFMERVRGPRPTAAPGTDDEPGFLQRALSARSRSSEPVWDEPSRSKLTEPPTGYRRPTQDLSQVRDPEAKKSSWWNPLSYVGGRGSDNDPVAQQGATMPTSAPQKGQGGALSSLWPF